MTIDANDRSDRATVGATADGVTDRESELTMALRDRAAVPSTEEEILAAHIGQVKPLNGPVLLAEYNPAWPQLYAREARRIRMALGDQVLVLEHVGSTSVPGLAAKPLIDILLVVPHSADEPAYVPALEAAGYVLRIREPDWYEHRMFKGPDTDINLHVLSQGCPEIAPMLLFRDWLRVHTSDRQLYERTKWELAQRTWTYTQQYADAKTAVVQAILARARGQGQEDPQGGEARSGERDDEDPSHQ